MSSRYGRTLTVVATVGSGLMAGVFFAFSTFVMTALGRLPDRQGLRAMREINDAAPTPWFTVPFIGIGIVCFALVVLALRRASTRQALYLLIGSGMYLVGLVVTLAYTCRRTTTSPWSTRTAWGGHGVEQLPDGLDSLERRAHTCIPECCDSLRRGSRSVPSIGAHVDDDASRRRARRRSRTCGKWGDR